MVLEIILSRNNSKTSGSFVNYVDTIGMMEGIEMGIEMGMGWNVKNYSPWCGLKLQLGLSRGLAGALPLGAGIHVDSLSDIKMINYFVISTVRRLQINNRG